MTSIRSFFYSLENTNNKSFYLAVLRVGISIWLLKEVCINYSSLSMIYGSDSFIVVKNNPLFKLFHFDVTVLRDHYIVVLTAYVLVILLNIFGTGRNVTAFLLYLFVEVLFRANLYVAHGGVFLSRFIVLYLAFANSYEYLTLFKSRPKQIIGRIKLSNLLTNLSAYAIMIHLCIVYFSSAIAKCQYNVWPSGEATYYIFTQENFDGTGHNAALVKHAWFTKMTTYYTIIFEFAFPFLIWVKRLRLPMIVMGLLLHAGIYFLMMIYGFQIVFMLTYGLFFSNQEWFTLIKYVRNKLPIGKLHTTQ